MTTSALLLGGLAGAPAAAAATLNPPAAVIIGTAAGDPIITGKVAVGQSVAIDLGRFTDTSQDALVEWFLDGDPQDGVLINGTTHAFFLPAAAAGKTLTAHLAVRTIEDNVLEFTLSGGEVAPGTFTTAPTPAISGTAVVDGRLTAQPGSWSPSGATFTYQWLRDGATISGATTSTYIPLAADLGKSISVTVTASKPGYNTSSKTSDAKKIAAGSLKPSKTLKVSGTARYGSTLKVSAGWPSGSKASYQWYRGTSKVSGATRSSYKLTSKDIGKTIQVKATVTKTGYNAYKGSAKSGKVGKAVFSTKSAPKISGTKKAGRTLKVSKGSYSAKPSSYSYRWYRGSSRIKGAAKSSYRLTASDAGKKITAKVTIKRSNYSSRTVASRSVTVRRD